MSRSRTPWRRAAAVAVGAALVLLAAAPASAVPDAGLDGDVPTAAQSRLELQVELDDLVSRTLDPTGALAVTDGSLPPGVSLTEVWSGRWQLRGRPSATGEYVATITAVSEAGTSTLTVAIRVVQTPFLEGALSLSAQVGTPVDATFRTAGWPVPTLTPQSALPDGLSLTQDTDDPYLWHLTGTPTREATGPRSITVLLDNGAGTPRTARVDVTVSVAQVWDPPSGTTFVVAHGEPFSVQLTVTGYPLGAVSSIVTTPAGAPLSFRGVNETVRKTITISGTLTEPTGVSQCLYDPGSSCPVPPGRHLVSFEPRHRPTVTAEDTAVEPGDEVRVPVTVASTHAFTLQVAEAPDWLALEPDGDGWVLTGAPGPDDVGVHQVTLVADNGVTGTATVGVVVAVPPSLEVATVPTLLVGDAVDLVLATAGGDPTPALSANPLPPGLTAVDDGAGALHLVGTPTTTADTWTVTVAAENPGGRDTRTVTMTVVQPARFAPDQVAPRARLYASYRWAPVVAGSGTVTVSLADGTLPPGIELRNGGLEGFAGQSGRFVFTLRAANAWGEDHLPVAIDVFSRPELDLPWRITIPAGEPVAQPIPVTGWEPPTLTGTGLPPGLEIAPGPDPGTWVLSGTVGRAHAGEYVAQISATNSVASTSDHMWIEVTAPVAWDEGAVTHRTVTVGLTTSVTVGTVRGYPIGAADVVADGVPLGYTYGHSHSSGPAAASVELTTRFTASGVYDVVVRVGGADHTVRFEVRDEPGIDLPAELTVVAGTPVDIPVQVHGWPTATALTVSGLPPGLVLVPDGRGRWRITGAVTPGTYAWYTLHLTASNGLTGSRSVEVAVVGPPVMSPEPPDTGVHRGSSVSQWWGLAASPAATIEVVGLPETLTVRTGGSGVRVDGEVETPGRYVTTWTATNEHGSTSWTWTLDVWDRVGLGTIDDAHLLTGVPAVVPLPVTGHPQPTLEATGLPAGLRVAWVDGVGAALVGTPETPGTHEVTLSARNTVSGFTTSRTATFTVVVDTPPRVTAPAATTVLVGETVDVTFSVAGAPAPDVTCDLPPWLAAERAGDAWRVTGTAPPVPGTHRATVTATNRAGEDTAVLELLVAEVPAFGALPDDVTLAAGEPFVLTVRGTGSPTPALDVDGLPPGLRVTAAGDGAWVVSGTVDRRHAGPGLATLRLANAAGTVRHALAYRVTAAPAWTPASDLVVTVGQGLDAVVATVAGYPLPDDVDLSGGPDGATARVVSTGPTTAEVRLAATFTAAGGHEVRLRYAGVEHRVTLVVVAPDPGPAPDPTTPPAPPRPPAPPTRPTTPRAFDPLHGPDPAAPAGDAAPDVAPLPDPAPAPAEGEGDDAGDPAPSGTGDDQATGLADDPADRAAWPLVGLVALGALTLAGGAWAVVSRRRG